MQRTLLMFGNKVLVAPSVLERKHADLVCSDKLTVYNILEYDRSQKMKNHYTMVPALLRIEPSVIDITSPQTQPRNINVKIHLGTMSIANGSHYGSLFASDNTRAIRKSLGCEACSFTSDPIHLCPNPDNSARPAK